MDKHTSPIVFDGLVPERDLWPGIEARITRRRPWRGLAAGIAASLVIIPLTLFWSGAEEPHSVARTGMMRSAGLMQSAHEKMTAPYLRTVLPSGVDVALAELAIAERAIHSALEENPGKQGLLKMLANIHQQRLGVLTKSIKVQEYI